MIASIHTTSSDVTRHRGALQAQAALNLLTAGKRPLPGDAATAATAPPAQRQRVDGGGPGAASTSQAGAQPDERSRGGAGIWVPGPPHMALVLKPGTLEVCKAGRR